MMDLYSITRRARREFGLSQGELASCLHLPRKDVIALESYMFVELDRRQLEILAIYSDNLPDTVQRVYATEQAKYKKEQEKKKRAAALVETDKEGTVQEAGAQGRADMKEITEMVAALPGPMQPAIIASFKAQLQNMVLGTAS